MGMNTIMISLQKEDFFRTYSGVTAFFGLKILLLCLSEVQIDSSLYGIVK